MSQPSKPFVQPGEPLQEFLPSFWRRQIDAAEQETPDYRHPPLPLARIKKVMKSDPDVKVRSPRSVRDHLTTNEFRKMIAADGTRLVPSLLLELTVQRPKPPSSSAKLARVSVSAFQVSKPARSRPDYQPTKSLSLKSRPVPSLSRIRTKGAPYHAPISRRR